MESGKFPASGKRQPDHQEKSIKLEKNMTEATKKAPAPQVEEDDFYDDATEAFPSKDDLAPLADQKKNPTTDGRLVAIWAQKNGRDKKANGQGMYDWTESITLVLDDGPDGDQVTDLVGPAPVELNLRHSTSGIQSRLAPRVDGMTKPKRDQDGNIIVPAVSLKFRPMIGRVNTRPSTVQKGGSLAFSIAAPTEEDKVIIEKHKALIKEINQRLEAKAAEVEDGEAFE